MIWLIDRMFASKQWYSTYVAISSLCYRLTEQKSCMENKQTNSRCKSAATRGKFTPHLYCELSFISLSYRRRGWHFQNTITPRNMATAWSDITKGWCRSPHWGLAAACPFCVSPDTPFVFESVICRLILHFSSKLAINQIRAEKKRGFKLRIDVANCKEASGCLTRMNTLEALPQFLCFALKPGFATI